MNARIGVFAVSSFAAVFIAFIALIAVSSVGTDQAQAHDLHTSQGWCGYTDNSGDFVFYHMTTHDVGLLGSQADKEAWCENNKGGAWMTTAQKNRIQGAISAGVFEVTSTDAFPDGWFEAPAVCVVLPTTGDDLTGQHGQNRLQHVKQAEAVELTLQIVYDVGSNELSGITGAILGTLLGVVKVTTFGWQWTYDLQDECQGNFARNTIQEIKSDTASIKSGVQHTNVDTDAIISDVQALLLAAATHSSQTSVDDLTDDVGDLHALLLAAASHSSQSSVDAVNTKVMAISSAVTALATSLTTETNEIDSTLVDIAASLAAETDQIDATLVILAASLATETDEIDAALAALALSLTTETDEIDAAIAALAASLITETDEIDAALAVLDAKLVAAQDQSVRLYIEDHLETCRSIVSLLLDDPDGLLPLLVLVVDDLATRAEASGWNIGNARQHMTNADNAFAAGNAGSGFQSLCTAYGKIVIGA